MARTTVRDLADAADAALVELFNTTGIDLTALPAMCTAAELALAIHSTTDALAHERSRGKGIPYVRVTNRSVRYSRNQVVKHLIENHGYKRLDRPEITTARRVPVPDRD